MEKEPDWRDKFIQEQVDKLGEKVEALIEEKTKNNTFWFICNMPPAILTVHPGDEFEYRKDDKLYGYKNVSIPGKSFDIGIYYLSQWTGYHRTIRVQKAEGHGWHLLENQIKAISSGTTGSEYNEFPFNQVKDFTELIGYLEKSKPLEIQARDFTWSRT